MFKSLYCAISATIIALAINSTATAQLSDMKKVYPTFEVLTVAGILTEAGLSYQITQLEGGIPLISAQVGPGKTIIMMPTRCQVANSSQCYSMLYLAFGEADQLPYPTLTENLNAVNALNEHLDLAKVYISEVTKAPVVSGFLNSDHGVSKGNIVASMSILMQTSDIFYGELTKLKRSSNTVSSRPLNEALAMNFAAGDITESGGGVVRSLLQNPAFQAWTATEDFQKDFTYQVSD